MSCRMFRAVWLVALLGIAGGLSGCAVYPAASVGYRSPGYYGGPGYYRPYYGGGGYYGRPRGYGYGYGGGRGYYGRPYW